MANKFVVLFGKGQHWWASGAAIESSALRQLLADPNLLKRWARNTGCHTKGADLRVRVVEIDEAKCPVRGQVRADFFTQTWVRLVPSDELPVAAVSHLRKTTTELCVVAS